MNLKISDLKKVSVTKYAICDSTIIHTAGITLLMIGIAMMLPMIAAMIFGDPLKPFAIAMLISIVIAIPLIVLFKPTSNMRPVDGILLIFILWLVTFLLGCVPYMINAIPNCMTFPDALFETVSGFTTTGSSIILNVEAYPKSILLWRCMTNWIGGIATILIFMSIFPLLGFGGRSIFRNEMSGSGSSNFTSKMKDAAKEFTIIYFGLSVIMLIICLALGVNLFEATCITFSAISTGGFTVLSSSIGGYSIAVQLIVILFMFLGGTNFYLHYQKLHRKGDGYLKNAEFKSMAIWFLVMSAIIFIIVGRAGAFDKGGAFEGYVATLFTVVSMGTSTGFAVVDYTVAEWVPPAIFLLFLVALMGGSTGSTSGGIKISRGVVVWGYLKLGLKNLVHPRAVFDLKVGKEAMDTEGITSAVSVMFLFLITIAVGTFIIMLLEPLSLEVALFNSMNAVANTGASIGQFGPFGNYSGFSDMGKYVMSALMWLGRIEIAVALALATPLFWKEIFRGKAKRKRRSLL